MSFEQFNDQEKKQREFNEQEEKEKIKKKLEFSKEKTEIIDKIDAQKELTYLKSLVERWLISVNVAKNIIEWKDLNNSQIEEILEKIDEIEEIKDVDKVLPKELRITKEEYLAALWDTESRQQAMKKLHWALDYIYHTVHPEDVWIVDISWIILLLNQNLVKVQDRTIDIKRNLEWIEKQQNPTKEEKKGFFTKLINLLKS